jgi:TRAP-type C4-dicarboxylate transport system substrate-binding protein
MIFAIQIDAGTAIGATDKIVWKFNSPFPPSAYPQDFANYFIEEVKEKSNGRMEIKMFPSAELGYKPQNYLRVTKDGLVEISYITAYQSADEPMISGIMGLPFIGATPDEWLIGFKAVKQEFNKQFNDKWNIEILTGIPAYPQAFESKIPVMTKDDFKGLKIRCSGRAQASLAKKLSATPVMLSAPEIYMSLQRGVCDSIFTAWGFFYELKLHEVVKYINPIAISGAHMAFGINKDAYDALPGNLKKILGDAADATVKYAMEQISKEQTEYQKKLIANGCKIISFSPEVEKEIKALGPALWNEYTTDHPSTRNIINNFIGAIEKQK